MERQSHGFDYQKEVVKRLNITESKGYTDKWDGILNGFPVSIKTEKLGSDIEMADYFRISSITEDFYLIVGFWDGEKTNIVDERILFIKGAEFNSLFNPIFGAKFKHLLASITNDRSDDEKWTTMRKELTAEYKQLTPNLVRPRFKRDHKTQKRIQCAINNKDFYNYFVKKYEVKI